MHIWAPTSVQRTAPSFPGCRLCFTQELVFGWSMVKSRSQEQGFGADGEERLFVRGLLREEIAGLPLVISEVR